ncbi:D-amino-acid dehydrogenase [Rubritalea squalenifaciens DSM 18772]|uniref:D-amino-acid dehydrogenase n=1 Tax=Rubritalea squalenifaciens DSM 18772 TaxID=1123071 RepID=A0A1M6P7V7_9BACT|nr:FAD-dependent oxidoreductase [Rubritalea squalenifaciens]SHK03983.1 D-amino-acid dehydrogenase [Rubritalea squalenifaciens DSM 18772]
MSDSKTAIIVGGGIVGLCSAYYAAKRGIDVVVLDRDKADEEGCSFGNAGMVVPSHFIPLAAPGMIAKGMRWMMNPESPFYVKPRLNLDLMRWGLLFWQHANEEHTQRCKDLLAKMSLESRQLFEDLSQDIGDFGLVKKGLLMLCNTQKGLDGEAEVARMANELGIRAEVCDSKRIAELDPAIDMNVVGGVWFEQDCHLEPVKLISLLRKKLAEMGVEIRYETEVTELLRKGKKVEAVQLKGGEQLTADSILLAGGAWTPELSKQIGAKIPMQAGKGYSLTLPNPVQLPELCSIFVEGKVAITPMADSLRFAGTMEVGGNDLSVNSRRVQGIIKTVKDYFPKFKDADFEGVEPWAGLRPCSPDGLPYIGTVEGAENVVVATGHAMMGLSLGPITGSMVADLMEGKQVDQRLSLSRF